ncbi:hypothetical protein BGY98DRAFT_995924, partial [Russula aff. rugulosa BPL654]
MLQFPPTMAATSKPISRCVLLAQRAARLLMVLGRCMEGKWEDAPQSLLENIHSAL